MPNFLKTFAIPSIIQLILYYSNIKSYTKMQKHITLHMINISGIKVLKVLE